ncbi:hypothetical protein [Microlunatus sp. GCM10028923]|uniref:hypothetical protein n=1 Tax=Microlunatus sp. GCM10028923 TaxID=3273400 RepID=UPI00360B4CE9
MRKLIGRIAAGGAALVAIPALAMVTALPSHADEDPGTNATARHGAYKAVFKHAGPEGETLQVYDNASDGDAAVAYVKFYGGAPEGHKPPLVDEDRFVVTDGYANLNLRSGDSGQYDVPEERGVKIMICRGYKSLPGDNCSPWASGLS